MGTLTGADRSVDYLNEWRVFVAGDGTVGSSISSVLSALGAVVTLTSGVDAQLLEAASNPAYDAVICDRVQSGTDQQYLEHVTSWLANANAAPRAWVTVSAFGLDGPARDYRGSNLVCSAAGGLLAAVYDPSGQLFEMPGQQALQAVGSLAVLAALHGVSLSRDLQKPVHQDLSAQEAVTYSTLQQDLAHLLGRCGGGGSSPRYSAPSGVFQCANAPIRISVIDNHQFVRFTQVVNQPRWVAMYPEKADRVADAEVIEAELSEWLALRSSDECERALQAGGIAATALRPVTELASSEQFQARGWPDQTAFTSTSGPLLPALVERRNRGKQARPPQPDRRLDRLRVVEATNVLAGPLAGTILGAMGAEVVRLEDATRMDIYRVNGPFVDDARDAERAAYFLGANHCKRSVARGIGAGQDTPQRALDWGNVMIENIGPSRLTRLGIDSQIVGAGNGGMSISISGFGRSGPSAHYRGYAANVHAFAGLEDAIVRVAGPDVSIKTSLADYCVAIWAATLATAWWLGGSSDDERVDLSMAEVIAARLTAVLAQTDGSDDENFIVDTAGGEKLAVTLRPGDDRAHVMSTLQDQNLLPDPHRTDDIAGALAVAAGVDASATVRTLQDAGIAAYVATTTMSILTDEQLRAREYFVELDHPVAGPVEIIALPWKLAGAERTGYRRAPLFGEDDDWAQQAFHRD
jgi:crotonobetainyl-CoA:carnitine CoA-transferase CaiB-like acyl-CoA transferase